MSRARDASYAYVVADDLDQAREDLAAEWSRLRRPRWAIDTGTPAPEAGGPVPEAPEANRLALRRARLVWEIETVEAAMPADVTAELEATRWQSRLWLQGHPEAGSRLAHLRRELAEVEHRIENRRRDLEGLEPRLSATERILATPAPHRTTPEPPVPVRSRGMSLNL